MDRRMFMARLAAKGFAAGSLAAGAIPASAFIPASNDEDGRDRPILQRLRIPRLRQLSSGLQRLFRSDNEDQRRILRMVRLAGLPVGGRSTSRIDLLNRPMITFDATRSGAPRPQESETSQFLGNVRLSGDPALVVEIPRDDLEVALDIVVDRLLHRVPGQGIRRDLRVPFLNDLPVVGQLFRSTSPQQRTSLVVFVTPRIIRAE